MKKHTKIIATVGPASQSPDVVRSLIHEGVNVFRINFSHGTEEGRAEHLQTIRAAERECGEPVAVCADLCGPKIRAGVVAGDGVELRSGAEIVIQRQPIEGSDTRISTTFPEIIDSLEPGQKILLADGRLELSVVASHAPREVVCRVVVGGRLSSGKGINLPQTRLRASALTEKDTQDLDWIARQEFDYVALSFVRSRADVDHLRQQLAERRSSAQIISKIEKPQALDDIDAIIEASDGIMVARGDLGVEMDFPAIPVAQKLIARKCQSAGKPCIIATEMMESMIESPRPTRAEVTDVANAVFDQADAVMLSAESAVGRYPVQTVVAMRRSLAAAELYSDEYGALPRLPGTEPLTAVALAASIRKIMQMLPIASIVVGTASGTTARLIAKNRPACPILALSEDLGTVRRCSLYYGVVARQADMHHEYGALVRQLNALVKQLGLARSGERILLVAGHPIGQRERTNGVVVETVS